MQLRGHQESRLSAGEMNPFQHSWKNHSHSILPPGTSGKYFTHTCQLLLKNLSHISTRQCHSCFPQLIMHTFIMCIIHYILFVCITVLFVTTSFGCTGSSLKARSMHYRPRPLHSLVGCALY